MNDLDERLTDLLTRSATAVTVQPDLDAVIDDDVVVDLDRRGRAERHRPRRVTFALVAAAILLVAVIAAVALAGTGGDAPDGVTDTPDGRSLPAERFPILDRIPSDIEGRVVARGGPLGDVSLLHQSRMFAEGTPVVRAVIFQPAADGTVTDAMLVQAVPGDLTELFQDATETTVAGRPARVVVDERTGSTDLVIIGDGASLFVHGGETTLEVFGLLDDLVLTVADGEPVLDLGRQLPLGVELLLDPGPAEGGEGVEVGVGEPGEPTVTVATGFDDPIAVIAQAAEDFTQVQVGPTTTGWLADTGEGSSMLSWRGPGGVALMAQGRLTPADLLVVARGVRLVDEETWVEAYGGEPDGIPVDEAPTAPTNPTSILGQPAPEISGAFTHVEAFTPPQSQGEWTILTIAASWCERCEETIAAVVEHAQVHPDGPGRPVTLMVDEPESASAAVDEYAERNGMDWPVLMISEGKLEDWSPGGTIPYLVIIDPDGIVRAVNSGPVDHDGLDAMLPEG